MIDWIVEQLSDVEKRAREAKGREKHVAPLISDLHSYEDQFGMCLQALSALALTRMYYDGALDERSARIEQQRIAEKSQGFLNKRRSVAGVIEVKIGALKGAPVALPRNAGKDLRKILGSQTPRAAAKEQLLDAKVGMQDDLREAQSKIKSDVVCCQDAIERISVASRSSRVLVTDGTDCWLVKDQLEKSDG